MKDTLLFMKDTLLFLKENRHNDYGCLMAIVDPTYGPHLIRFGQRIVPPSILYTDPNDPSYGYDDEPHVTVKYGFTKDLNKDDLASILRDVTPFNIVLNKMTQFQNEKYDVVKFDVAHNDVLNRLRDRVDVFENEDKYPDYHPHMTVAYVQKDKFPYTKDNLKIKLPISRFKYSGKDGRNLYINL